MLSNTQFFKREKEIQNTSDLVLSQLKTCTTIKDEIICELSKLRDQSPMPEPSFELKNYAYMLSIPNQRADQATQDEEIKTWLSLPISEIFTWNHYALAHHSHSKYKEGLKTILNKIVEIEEKAQSDESAQDLLLKLNKSKIIINDTLVRCVEICFFYYKFQKLDLEEPGWVTEFMNHAPYDYTRPHGWYDSPNYVSMGEAISAVLHIKLQKDLGESTPIYIKTLEMFEKQHSPHFSRITNLSDLRIPYEFYSECFDQLKSPLTIKPHSIEICFYYFKQNGLDPSDLLKHKVLRNFWIPAKPELNRFYWVPSLKFCDLYDYNRIIAVNNLYSCYFSDYSTLEEDVKRFDEHFQPFYFTQRLDQQKGLEMEPSINSNLITNFEWWGLAPINENISYRQRMSHFFSFFDEFTNLLSYGIFLDSQLKVCHLLWKQTSNLATTPQSSVFELRKPVLKALIQELFKITQGIDSFKIDKTILGTRIQEKGQVPKDLRIALLAEHFTISKEVYELERLVEQNSRSVPQEFLIGSDDLQMKLISNLKQADISILFSTEKFEEAIKYVIYNMACIQPHIRPSAYVDFLTKNESEQLSLRSWLRLPSHNPEDNKVIQHLFEQNPHRETDGPYAL